MAKKDIDKITEVRRPIPLVERWANDEEAFGFCDKDTGEPITIEQYRADNLDLYKDIDLSDIEEVDLKEALK